MFIKEEEKKKNQWINNFYKIKKHLEKIILYKKNHFV